MKPDVKMKYESSLLGTAWLKFLIYFRLPISWIFAISNIFMAISYMDQYSFLSNITDYSILLILAEIVFLFISISTFIQMKNLNEAGYSLFFINEVFYVIFNTIVQADSYSALGSILGFLIWFIPNAIYIKKRKYLFYNLYSSQNNSSENYSVEEDSSSKNYSDTDIRYCNQCGAALPFIGDYCNQCGAKKTRISDKKREEENSDD